MNSESLTRLIGELPRVWQGLGRTRQLLAAGAAGAFVLVLLGAALYLQRPRYVPLYTNLSAQDAAAIAAKLKEQKVPYQLTDGGATILVPQDAAPDLRLQLVSQGLPSGSGVSLVGMEVFDRTNLGITDFAQRLNYQRALEGELTRTISRLSAVQSARVHLALPQDRLLTSQQQPPTASVVLQLKPGAKLSNDQVSSIKLLVSKSVEGLQPENVAVVDTNGNALGDLSSPQELRDKEAAARMEVQRQREADLEKKIQGLLDTVLGPNHAVVRATVDLDWNDVKQDIETFSPSNTQPQVRSQQDEREQFNGQGVAAVPPVGVPGTQSNVPSYQAAQPGETSSYQHSKVTTNYEISSDKQSIVRAPGTVKSIGIAVMIDQSVKAAQADQISQAVAAAAGIQPARGDQVAVIPLPFDEGLAAQLKKQQEEQRNMEIYQLSIKLAGVALAFIGIFFLFRYLLGTLRPKVPPALPAAEPVSLPGGAAALLPPSAVEEHVAEAAAMLPDWARPIDRAAIEAQVRQEIEAELRARQEQEAIQQQREAELAHRQQIRESLINLASEKPDVIAEVLSSWLERTARSQPSAV